MAHMIPACFLTTLTTSIGFLSLMFASADILQGFGWQAAMGLAMILVSIIAIFISVGSWFRAPKFGLKRGPSPTVGPIEKICLVSYRNPWWAIALTLLPVLLAGLWSLGVIDGKGVKVNSYLVETIDETNPEIKSLKVIEGKLGGFLPVEVILKTSNPGNLTTIDSMNRIRRIQSEIKQCSGVSLAYSLVDIFSIADSFGFGTPAIGRDQPIDDNSRVAQRLMRIENVLRKKRGSSGLAQFLTKDEREARILIHLKDVGTVRGREIISVLEQSLEREFPTESGIETKLTGEIYYGFYSLDNFVTELLISLFFASLLIFLILALFF